MEPTLNMYGMVYFILLARPVRSRWIGQGSEVTGLGNGSRNVLNLIGSQSLPGKGGNGLFVHWTTATGEVAFTHISRFGTTEFLVLGIGIATKAMIRKRRCDTDFSQGAARHKDYVIDTILMYNTNTIQVAP